MSRQHYRQPTAWLATTEPFLIEAYRNFAMVDVSDRKVEIVLDFSEIPDEQLAHPLKIVSKDPAVIAFHQRIYDALQRRHDAWEARYGDDDPETIAEQHHGERIAS